MKIVSIPEDLQGITRFNIQISDVEEVNPLVSKCFIKILYPGFNRNGVYISKEVANEMAKTLQNIPIVGEFVQTIDDFKDHGGRIEITSDDIQFIQTTKPYGFVPEGAEVAWQEVVEADGEVREYLTCTGYLWTGRYPEVKNVIEQSRPQSMELDEESLEGYWKQEQGSTYFFIEKAKFSALCILGNDVPPAFESAQIGSYYVANPISFSKQLGKFIRIVEETLSVSNFSTNVDPKDRNLEGGSDMLQFNLNLSADDIQYKLYDVLNPATEENRELNYSIISIDEEKQEVTFVENTTQKTFTQKYEINDDVYSLVDEPQEIALIIEDRTEIETLQSQYAELETKYAALEAQQQEGNNTEEIDNLKQEIEQLKEFKLNRETEDKNNVISKFKSVLSAEDIQPFEDDLANFTVEQLEEKLSVVVLRKANFSFSDLDLLPDGGTPEDNLEGWEKLVKAHNS